MSAIAVGQYKSAKEMQTFSTLGVVSLSCLRFATGIVFLVMNEVVFLEFINLKLHEKAIFVIFHFIDSLIHSISLIILCANNCSGKQCPCPYET